LSISHFQVIQSSNTQLNIHIPSWIIGIQCIAFIVLYAVWGIPETMGFRNTALVTGAVFSLYPIYQFRHFFVQKTAIPIWLLVIAVHLGCTAFATVCAGPYPAENRISPHLALRCYCGYLCRWARALVGKRTDQ
jgi:hypothetical protein